MWARLDNLATIRLECSPSENFPLLIKEGSATLEPGHPDMAFHQVGVHRSGKTTQVPIIPGSSVRGAFRQAYEQHLASAGIKVKDISTTTPPSNQKSWEEDWKDSDEAERLFGSTQLRSRLTFADAFPKEIDRKPTFVVRSGVCLERGSQAPKGGALFNQEVLVKDKHLIFPLEMKLTNFRLHELAAIVSLFLEMDEGLIRFGHGKSRGLGGLSIQSLPDVRIFSRTPGGISGICALAWWQKALGETSTDQIAWDDAKDKPLDSPVPGLTGRKISFPTMGRLSAYWKGWLKDHAVPM